MTRQTAWAILTKYVKNPVLIQHSLATEAVMRALAPRFKEDVEEWGIVGLLHDADYERAKGHPEEHGILLFRLEPNAIPTVIEHAIEAHNYEFTQVIPESPMDWAITCCDQLTGIIIACTHELKDKKLANLTLDIVLKKLQNKDFSAKSHAANILHCEEKLKIPLNEFIQITLSAIQGIHDGLGL